MNVYIAASLQLLSFAKHLAEGLAHEGVRVASTWHAGEPTIAEEAGLSLDAQTQIATQCLGEIERAEALVLLYDGGARFGSILETGYALGLGLPVVAVRTGAFALPTLLLQHPFVFHPEGELAWLGSEGVCRALREASK